MWPRNAFQKELMHLMKVTGSHSSHSVALLHHAGQFPMMARCGKRQILSVWARFWHSHGGSFFTVEGTHALEAPQAPRVKWLLGRTQCWGVTLLVICGGMLTVSARSFRITSAGLSNGSFRVAFPGRADSYYFLNSGSSPKTASNPVAAALGQNVTQSFTLSAHNATAMFFRAKTTKNSSFTT